MHLIVCNIKIIFGRDFDEINMPDIKERDIINPPEDYRCIDGIIKLFFEDKFNCQYLTVNASNIEEFNTQIVNVLKSFGIIN